MSPVGLRARIGAVLYVSLAALALLSGRSTALPAAAQQGRGPVTELFRKDLAGIPGKELLVSLVQVMPGGTSVPHRHDANVVVYVLEGELLMQIEGHASVTVGPGQTFYEGPDDVHLKSDNASAVKPAKFLAFLVKDKDRPVSRSVTVAPGGA